MKYFALILFLVVVNSTLNAADVFGLIWEPKILFDSQLFPSYAWANATRNAKEDIEKDKAESEKLLKGDREGQLGFTFTNLNSKAYQLVVHVECPEIMEKSTYTTMASKSLTKFEIFPEIAYKFDILKSNKEPRPISVKFTVYVDGKLEGTVSKNIILRSKNDCPYTFLDDQNNTLDLNYMYATYVNENNPRIANEILPAILKQGAISSISGYQNGKEGVYQQVFAVWNYFNSLGIKYSSLNSPSQKISQEKRPYIMYQYVRTLDEAIDSKQANCVDGTVAMASVLYKMGIQPFIITTPNHCFLGFLIDPKTNEIAFVETTLFGSTFSDEEYTVVNEQIGTIDKNLESKYPLAFSKFKIALFVGMKNYSESEELFNAYNPLVRLDLILNGKQDEIIERVQYRMFTVDSYRKTGLIPIN